jgi:hypothetical protein
MDIYMPMSTTARHNKLTSSFVGSIFDLLKRKEVHVLSEECSLVYWGRKSEPNMMSLIKISEIEDINEFKACIIDDLYYVQPDVMIFKQNPYVENIRQTRTAGQPDLIVEVWSDGNTKNDKAFLQNLYATSSVTEHWYITQKSNKVECYYGRDKLENQSLKNILKSRGGLEFDLRYLAI